MMSKDYMAIIIDFTIISAVQFLALDSFSTIVGKTCMKIFTEIFKIKLKVSFYIYNHVYRYVYSFPDFLHQFIHFSGCCS
jgi:hypothetical protein